MRCEHPSLIYETTAERFLRISEIFHLRCLPWHPGWSFHVVSVKLHKVSEMRVGKGEWILVAENLSWKNSEHASVHKCCTSMKSPLFCT